MRLKNISFLLLLITIPLFLSAKTLNVPSQYSAKQSAIDAVITFNEVMSDAIGSDYYDEFIEIVNYSDSIISLHGAYLLINGNVDTLDFPNSDTLAPNSYALILDRGYLIGTNSHTYDELIPDSTLLLTIQDNSFGLSNSEPNTLLLISESGVAAGNPASVTGTGTIGKITLSTLRTGTANLQYNISTEMRNPDNESIDNSKLVDGIIFI